MSKSKKLSFSNSTRKLSELKGADWNPRQLTKKQADDLKKSLQKFDLAEVPVVNLDGMIIAGHQRTKILSQLHGDIEIDVRVPSRLMTEDEVKEYNVRSNKNTGEWDFDLLANNFELEDLLDWGFTEEELRLDLEPEVVEGNTDEDEVPEAPDKPITVAGDVWLLGGHRLMCGDSTSIDAVEKLLNGAKPNLMVTDPPYGVEYNAGWRAEAKGTVKTEREKQSTLENDDRSDWYDAWILFPGEVAYVWHASSFTDVVMDSLRRADFEIKQQIIWNKNVHALSRSAYHWKHEPCWYVVKNGKTANWLAGRDQMTVWDIPSVIFEKDKTAHPTQKSLGIYEKPIENHTVEGDALYEPFGGSGTQIIACEKHKRISYTMELFPMFCDVTILRWQNFTGKQATHADTGLTFDEHKAAGLPKDSV